MYGEKEKNKYVIDSRKATVAKNASLWRIRLKTVYFTCSAEEKAIPHFLKLNLLGWAG